MRGNGLTRRWYRGADYYECAYDVGSLTNAAIVDLDAEGELQERLKERTFRGRYLNVDALGQNQLFDHTMTPSWAA